MKQGKEVIMKKIGKEYTDNTFENIKYIDENGNEYWYARELSKVLEYRDWRNFLKVLNKAKDACNNSGFDVDEQLVEVNRLSKRNNNAITNIQDYKLSRYICYLIVQNANVAAVNHKDTYKASAVFLIVMGILYLIDKFIGFASHGLPWVMQKDNLLLYAAVIFLWFKADKSVGIVLAGIWLILNIGLVIALLGQMSAYLLPVALLLLGVILYLVSTR